MNILALTSLAMATLYNAVTPVSAEGYVTTPPSRQARCKNDNVPGCGAVRYDPQSVEAAHGSFLCNGHGPKFLELNDECLWRNFFYTVSNGSEKLSVYWEIDVAHRTTTFEYFLLADPAPIQLLSVDYQNKTLELPIKQHDVPLNKNTGRHTILARWNIGDTGNSFYSCVDIFIPGSLSPNDAKNPVLTDIGGQYGDQTIMGDNGDTCPCRKDH